MIDSQNSIAILFSSSSFGNELLPKLNSTFNVHAEPDINALEAYLKEQSLFNLPDVILLEVDDDHECFNFIKSIKSSALLKGLVIVLLSPKRSEEIRQLAMKHKVNDLYVSPIPLNDLCERIIFLVKFKLIKPQLADLSQVDYTYEIPFPKRLFDIFVSGSALLFLSPLLLIVALIIRLESKGAVIFKSKRVGTGYRVFDFYKFRSMRSGASAELQDLSDLNQYKSEDDQKSIFVKLKNDPRITKFGQFIRTYSIDELPQLFNVFIGDMSLVGNRPLPLYEAEMLTSNEWSMRFLGPAGLTGLWQVSRRGKADMSERERKRLDNFYAQNHSFWLDLKILMKTLPAAVQKEKV
ncbi:sugar transferase [Pedobacter metabolipauper]|uniref:Lipopolysaccharide/colanic/teichoic acid biosynthesis glycosyltransferase n=1 Tax=Pedobacter metabolipauper TaxID=425513 RepID=A0A4R6T0V8_9SPHI|nr:sugar transferase [Pedobacter metabolipauper]TDQ12017.1 lipopolysaccharide/colanic/teichoic acid biosynthesis glycosyltransferase [Pedobacter metabolipauper]